MTKILTERLTIREMEMGDLDFVAAMLAHPEVMRYYPKTYSRAEARQWVERQIARYRSDGCGLWLVENRITGEPVGQVGLILRTVNGDAEPEIGYLIHHPFWRQGLATEAGTAVRDNAFSTRKFDHVISLIRPENLPSQGVARKLGMRPAGTTVFCEHLHLIYVLRRDEADFESPAESAASASLR